MKSLSNKSLDSLTKYFTGLRIRKALREQPDNLYINANCSVQQTFIASDCICALGHNQATPPFIKNYSKS